MQFSLESLLPLNSTCFHIIGIGGYGMSGIAEILHNLGYKVQGSDASESAIVTRLKGLGIKVFIGQNASNISDTINFVVKSTAIKDENPEIVAARGLDIPVINRAEMLAELMRFKHSIAISGSHGKTTTTSLVACIFEEAGLKPTVINGGVINRVDTNAYLGDGPYLIAEADESDGTFIKVPATSVVVTNIDPEHLDHYGTFENLKSAYAQFITNLPFYGFAVLCKDHPVVYEIAEKITSRRIIFYSIKDPSADLYATNIRTDGLSSTFDVILSRRYKDIKKIENLTLSTLGMHNVSNSLSAVAMALENNIEVSIIKKALAAFGGVKRRFTKTDEVDEVLFVDDYAHHPVEIETTLAAAKSLAQVRGGKVIAVAQPHRYSRVSDLMADFTKCFTNADELIISEIYAAGEKPLDGVTTDDMIAGIATATNQQATKLNNPSELPTLLNNLASSKDIVIFLGAGDVTKWAYETPKQIRINKKL
jgi:UDP-N-acetylmuramate--alanine ligase